MTQRVLKFRAWHNVNNVMTNDVHFLDCLNEMIGRDYYTVIQFTGLCDKSGKEIYEGDLLRVINRMGDDSEEWFTDAIYRVNNMTYAGFAMSFVRLFNDTINPAIQFPIAQQLSYEYKNLCTDHRNENYDNIALCETYGNNHNSRSTWRENHYSNDVSIIGNALTHPDLLK